jgi:Adenylate cyclase regulatory domain
LYVGIVAEEVDVEALGLLDGLEGDARRERAELIVWLLDRGFTVDQIKDEFAPMLMPAGRIVGDDGVYVSARQICEETGIDLELLEANQRALGLPRTDDPDAAIGAPTARSPRGRKPSLTWASAASRCSRCRGCWRTAWRRPPR